MRRTLAWAGTAAVLLLAPAAAHASVYCVGVSGSSCVVGPSGPYAATGDGLQLALNDADTNVDIGGGPDTVRIGPGTYARSGGDGFHTAGGDLTVEGAGQSTVLTTDATSGRVVLRVNTAGSGGAVRNLRVQLAGDSSGISEFDQISDVRVTGPGSAAAGIQADAGGRVSRVVIDPASVGGEGIVASSSVFIDDVSVLMRNTGKGASAVALFNANTSATANSAVRHLTVLGDGRAGTSGVEARAFGGASGPGTLTVNVRDSVIRNVGAPLIRMGDGSSMTKPGVANVAFRYSSLDATRNQDTGPGSYTPGPGNLPDPDPLFAADLSPSPGSPLIDAGDPAGPEAGDSPTDVAGNPRIAGGRRDIGAFETQFPPPVPPGQTAALPGVTTASASALAVSPRAFRAAGSGPAVSAARRAPVGAIVSYVLNEDASVRFTVRQVLRGRRVGKGRRARCVKPTARNRKARSCRRLKTRGSFSQVGRAGRNSFRFRGRLRGKKLKPGRYTLVARPTAGGTAGAAIRTTFRIVR